MKIKIDKKVKRYISLFMVATFAFAMATGCGRAEVPEDSAAVVFTFLGDSVTLGEVYVYAETIKQSYETSYGPDIWTETVIVDDASGGSGVATMEEITRRDIIDNIIKVRLLYGKADEYGIHLSEEDMVAVQTSADNFWQNLTDEQINSMELSKELVYEIMLENAVSVGVYNEALRKADIEVSDESARMTTFFDMCFQCYTENEDGSIVPYTEEEKKVQYERALQAYSTLIDPIDTDNKDNVESLADFYNLKYSKYYTLSPEDILLYYGEDIYSNLYSLEDGSYSLVTETADGYHIFYMKALTDSEATLANKNAMLKKEKEEFFNAKYAEWMGETAAQFNYDSDVDIDVYSRIKFN